MALISVIHGPNLNLLGSREVEIYGSQTLAEIDDSLRELANELGHSVECFQSNVEGALVDRIQSLRGRTQALLINPAAYTHTSVAIRDAVLALGNEPLVIEVHLSVPAAREPVRKHSFLADIVAGRVEGFGGLSYLLALRAASELIARRGHR